MFSAKINYGTERARKTFERLARQLGDLTNIWEEFIDYWQNEVMPKSFESKGSLMEGQKWTPYSDKYKKWKKKNYGSSMPNLIVTGKMQEATMGGPGWYEKKEKSNLEIGIAGEDYYYYVSERNKNPRKYFYTTEGSLPASAWKWLIDKTNEKLEAVDSDQ